MSEDKFLEARREIHAKFKAGEISERTRDDALRVIDAEEAQARMLAALPDYPRYGFYVKTGLAGYGPDLDENDMPCDSWESVADVIASELRYMAEFNDEGASATADQAEERYQDLRYHGGTGNDASVVDGYRDAWQAHKLAGELDIMAQNFAHLADADNPAPLYQGRPDLRHARIWDLITANFPLDVSHNSRLYVWECEEAPQSEED